MPEYDDMGVGQLAKATGVTVRTLHHYDAIGLLRPDGRHPSGRRVYSTENVGRLYRILALRRLGLPLDEIARALDEDEDLAGAVRRHLERVERSLELQQRLRATLRRMVDLLDRRSLPGRDELIQTIEVMTMIEKHYTPEQLEALERRRSGLGDDAIRAAEQSWAELIEEVGRARADGIPPTDPGVQALAERWRGLIARFTGGDDGIRRSLETMYREEGPERASHGAVDSELMDYVGRALAVLPPPAG